MTFADLLVNAGLTPRACQAGLSAQLAEHLAPRRPVAVAVQAATGVGKTWVLAHAAVTAAEEGRRVVYSTHSILLRTQALATLQRALAATCPDPARRPVLAERRGRADFPSASRTLRLRHAWAARGADAAKIALLDALAGWAGPIADFVAAYGELPVPLSLVCLTATCPDEEQAAYRAQRDAAATAAIVVQTHALTLIEARFRRLATDLVLFDEADTLPAVAAGAVEMRLRLDECADLASHVAADIAAPLAVLRGQGGEPGSIRWRDRAQADAARTIAARLRDGAGAAAPELAESLRDTADELMQFAAIDRPDSGAAVVEDEAAGTVLAIAAVDAAGWLGDALRDKQTVLLSATLGAHEDDDLARACRRLGFFGIKDTLNVSPGPFGTLAFRLADRAAPRPFDDGEPQPAFFDYAADVVRQAAATGRTLVLCASYADADALAGRLPAQAIVQRRGERLNPLVERFRAEPNAILVTPTAWTGLDLPGLVDNVVIVRLPTPRPDDLRKAVLTGALQRRGRSEVDAEAVLGQQAHGETMRRLTQGIGRGIRSEADRCTVWIADPRFPLPPGMTVVPRFRQTPDSCPSLRALARAIPLRFRQGARSAYEQARIVPLTARSAAA